MTEHGILVLRITPRRIRDGRGRGRSPDPVGARFVGRAPAAADRRPAGVTAAQLLGSLT